MPLGPTRPAKHVPGHRVLPSLGHPQDGDPSTSPGTPSRCLTALSERGAPAHRGFGPAEPPSPRSAAPSDTAQSSGAEGFARRTLRAPGPGLRRDGGGREAARPCLPPPSGAAGPPCHPAAWHRPGLGGSGPASAGSRPPPGPRCSRRRSSGRLSHAAPRRGGALSLSPPAGG